MIQMPSPEEPLFGLMAQRMEIQRLHEASRNLLYCVVASVSFTPLFNMATLHSVTLTPMNTLLWGEAFCLMIRIDALA